MVVARLQGEAWVAANRTGGRGLRSEGGREVGEVARLIGARAVGRSGRRWEVGGGGRFLS